MTSQQPTDDQVDDEAQTEKSGPVHADMDAGVHRPAPEASHATWTTGEKYGVGTACDHDEADPSRVWFTLTEGALTEPRFPRVDLMQFRLVDFLIAAPESGYTARTHNVTRTDDDEETIERVTERADSEAPVYRQEITETGQDGHQWSLVVEYATNPGEDALLLDAAFQADDGQEYDVYVVAEAALSGHIEGTAGRPVDAEMGYALTAWETGDTNPVFSDGDGDGDTDGGVTAALAAASGFEWAAAGSYDDEQFEALFDDGLAAVSPRLAQDEDTSGEGDRVLVGRIGSGVESVSETVALGFAEGDGIQAASRAARRSLDSGFEAVREEYADGWRSYLADRPIPDAVDGDPDLKAQYHVSVMMLRAVADKTIPGASVASPSVPWGENVDATVPRDYGYNFTWSRDLYQVFTALSAVDDVKHARQSVEYLYGRQQREDGFLPQNTYLDGRTRWDGEQLDNVAFPSVMAYQLDRTHGVGFTETSYGYADVRRSAEYLLRNGPRTEQERWEEEDGYSPSTIAAVTAGLGCAAALAADEGERADALAYLAHADAWRLAVDEWCVTTDGAGGLEAPYYVRVSGTGEPDSGLPRELDNNGPTLDERKIIDAGFLELVRLGLREPDETVVENSLAAVDEVIRVDTPNGPAWYRYNGDGYGELGPPEPDEGGPWSIDRNGAGRLWPLLTGERAEYELLAEDGSDELAPRRLLETLSAFANSGGMLPEQVWDRPDPTEYGWEFGEGTGSATPLSWAIAQYVRLAHGIDAGEPVETPAFLARRYRDGEPGQPSLLVRERSGADGTVTVRGETDGDELVVWTPSGTRAVDLAGGEFEVQVDAGAGELALVAATADGDLADVGTSVTRLSWRKNRPSFTFRQTSLRHG